MPSVSVPGHYKHLSLSTLFSLVSFGIFCLFREGVKMAQEFVIPLSRDDLLNKTAVNQFTVEEILPLRLIPGALQGERLFG